MRRPLRPYAIFSMSPGKTPSLYAHKKLRRLPGIEEGGRFPDRFFLVEVPSVVGSSHERDGHPNSRGS